MIKDFDELYKLDISSKVKKYQGFDYLNWLDCLMLLRENGAGVVSYDCSEIFELRTGGALVMVWVEIDDKRCSITHPVASGDVNISEPKALDVGFAIQRAFVKCVAINWGLGLSLWEKGVDVAVDDSGVKESIVKVAGNLIGPKFEDHESLMQFIMSIQGVGEKISETKGRDTWAKLGNFLETGPTEDKRKILSQLQSLLGDEIF